MVAEKAKLVMKINTGAAVLGLGYIVGLNITSGDISLMVCVKAGFHAFSTWLPKKPN